MKNWIFNPPPEKSKGLASPDPYSHGRPAECSVVVTTSSTDENDLAPTASEFYSPIPHHSEAADQRKGKTWSREVSPKGG